MNNTTVNLVHDDKIVNLCNTYGVENPQWGEKVVILDPGTPVGLAGRPWLRKYFAEFDWKIEDMVVIKCFDLEELTKGTRVHLG